MGFRQRTEGSADLGYFCQAFAFRQAVSSTHGWSHIEGRRRQPGDRGAIMGYFPTLGRLAKLGAGGGVIAAWMLAAASMVQAQQAPLMDKPFAEHRIVLQLSD